MTRVFAVVLAFFLGAGNASAAIVQVWELTGVVSSTTQGFTPPAFAALGKTITLDYSFDLATPPGLFSNPILSIAFNGQTSSTSSGNGSGNVIYFTPSFIAINAGGWAARSDGVNFLSLNNFSVVHYADQSVANALADTAAAIAHGNTQLRMDFGTGQSVFLALSSFRPLNAVPEPASAALLLAGLAAATLTARRGSRRQG